MPSFRKALSAVCLAGLLLICATAQSSRLRAPSRDGKPGGSAPAVKNTWRGLTPLRSTAAEAAQSVGTEADLSQVQIGGPYRVEGGEVTFSFLTPSLAKLYRAPRAMIGKVFTIYFTPGASMRRSDLQLAAGFKKCTEQQTTAYYYLVNAAGVAYRLRRSDDTVETIIYQPSHAEIRTLAVMSECVF